MNGEKTNVWVGGNGNSPGVPTINVMSAISGLLNIAALRSRTVGLVACQFGSCVALPGGEAGEPAGDGAWLVEPLGDGGPL